MARYLVGVDVGGTFTDCLVMEEGGLLEKFKASTTPSDPTKGFMNAMGKAARRIGGTGAGATLKLVNNMLSGTVNAAKPASCLNGTVTLSPLPPCAANWSITPGSP